MDKEHTAIARIQKASRMSEKYYQKPLIVTTSGVSESTIYAMERGTRKSCRTSTFKLLASALGVNPWDLVK